MTDQQHPITPPPEELRRQWQSECPFFVISVQREDWMIDRAAQWGADQELEACIEWFDNQSLVYHRDLEEELRAARRPEPLSLKEQALEALERMDQFPTTEDKVIILRALEQLND